MARIHRGCRFMVNTVAIHNLSSIPQFVVHQGVRHSIRAHEEKLFPHDIAEKFISTCVGKVVKATNDFGTPQKDTSVTKTVWLANVTGDPDSPDTVFIKSYDRNTKSWGEREIHNPVKDPRPIRYKARGTAQVFTASDGALEAKNIPGRMLELGPYKRVEWPANYGTWFIGMAATPMPQVRGLYLSAVIASRPPSTFEPDMDWPLDEINCYLSLVDLDAPQGPGEKDILSGPDHDVRVHEAKRIAMKRLYFRLVYPMYRLPTRSEFTEAFSGTYVKHGRKANVPMEEIEFPPMPESMSA